MMNLFAKIAGNRSLKSRLAFGLAGSLLAIGSLQTIDAKGNEAGGLKAELIALSPMFEYIADNFDGEMDALATQIEVQVAAGVDPRSAGAAAMTAFRIEHADDIGAASDKAQRALLASMIEVTELVLAQEGPKVCARYASYGYVAFNGTPLEAKYADVQLEQVMLTLAAARAGLNNPVVRSDVSDEDNVEVGAAMAALGATEAQLDAILSGTTKDAALCEGMLNLMRAMNADGDTAGARVRAQFLTEVSGA